MFEGEEGAAAPVAALLDQLATYCLHALTAAGNVSSKAAVRRLVKITLAGLHA